MKKHTYIFVLALLFPFAGLQAKEKPEYWKERSPYEISLGIELGVNDHYYDTNYNYYYNYVTGDNTINTKTLTLPSFNLGFNYKLTKRYTIGVISTFNKATYTQTAIYDNHTIQQHSLTYISIAPRIRFDWLNAKYITLYSSLSLGLGYTLDREKISGDINSSADAYAEATFLGIKAGKALFGFADFSTSSAGYVRIGIGYNFKHKKH